MGVSLSAAQAAPATAKKATVVKVVTRMTFGKMLAKTSGRALYIHPVGKCTGVCLTAWPPLLMPKGTKIPEGTKCLKTVAFGSRLQVTYRGKRLYSFVDDTGKNVTGNDLEGFKVAKISTKACPK
jgi:predicted lipoprotein with Yx(FWY)xxD motif